MNAADIRPVSDADRTLSSLDLFLIFAGANIVATTLQAGASLGPAFTATTTFVVIAAGSVAGALLVAALTPIGTRLGVPSVIAARAALGVRGAGLVAIVLYTTNFAWIAINNLIAASACAAIAGGPASEPLWALGLGVLATAIVAAGPTAVRLADRFAVPVMLALFALFTIAVMRLPAISTVPALATGSAAADVPANAFTWIRGLDVVIGYQASWLLMFGDYPRYTRSARGAAVAVFLALALVSIWLMGIGAVAARAAGSADPGAMVQAVGLGVWGALLMTLAGVTTNFVNIYMSSLAWKSLFPRASDQVSVWSIGLIGAGLGFVSRGWLDRYASFMLVLGGILVPVGGVLFAHFFVLRERCDVDALYDDKGIYGETGGISVAGVAAWVLGAAAFYLSSGFGGTLPALAVAMAAYVVLKKLTGRTPMTSDR